MNKIKHFMLPKHSNEIYSKEAISSISLTRDIADKINEIIDRLNKNEDLAWKQGIEGKVEKGVLFMKDNLLNSIHDLLKLYLDTKVVDEILVEVVNSGILGVIDKTNYFTPEMYGAVGDGITDDTEAILDMIKDIENKLSLKEFGEEIPCKDWSKVTIKFNGTYKINSPIQFKDTYGLTLDNLKLVASDSFIGSSMIQFIDVTRNLKLSNVTIDGKLVANRCINFSGYTLTVDMSNIELTHFVHYGIYASGKGHELKGVNIKINQYEWEELDKMGTTGVGLYLGEERYDNHFTNLVINYCGATGLELAGGTSTFVNCHFYSCDIVNKGRYNTFDGCYFDNASFKTHGFFTLINSILLRSGESTLPFIYFLVSGDSNSWQYDTCNLNGNTFKSEAYIENAIDLGALTEMPKFNTIGNTFYYVKPFTSVGRLGHTKNPWDMERESFGDETNGYRIYGNLAIIWGTVSANGFVTYPNGLELAETIHIGFERQDNKNPNLIPWANTIRPNQFWINSVGTGSTVKYTVLGIVK